MMILSKFTYDLQTLLWRSYCWYRLTDEGRSFGKKITTFIFILDIYLSFYANLLPFSVKDTQKCDSAMANSVFSSAFLQSQIESVDIKKLFLTLLLFVCIGFMFVLLRLTFWRRRFMHNLPGHKCSVFNVFGNVLDFSFSSKSRNGFHFAVSKYTAM